MRRLALALWLLALVPGVVCGAASKQYANPETAITFQDSGGAVTFGTQNLASGAGRISARADKGAGAQSPWIDLRCTVQASASISVNTVVEVYVATSDGTNPDGQLGTSDGALATDKRSNLKWVMNIVADQTSSNTNMTASKLVYIPTRYYQVGFWNVLGVNLRNTANSSLCSAMPVPLEQQ